MQDWVIYYPFEIGSHILGHLDHSTLNAKMIPRYNKIYCE